MVQKEGRGVRKGGSEGDPDGREGRWSSNKGG